MYYKPVGKTIKTVLDSDFEKRMKKKDFGLIEFWGYQLLDALEALQWLHSNDCISGSVSANNVFYKPDDRPRGLLHAPALREGNEKPRNKEEGHWPYYRENDGPIGADDDILAAAVLISECLFADSVARRCWNDLILLGDKYDYNPGNLILDVSHHWKQMDDPLRPLALTLE